MTGNPIRFGTSGWRAVIADEFTFANVRRVIAAIAEYVHRQGRKPVLIVGHDTRFFSEEFAHTAAEVLRAHGIRVLMCEGPAPTPAIAYEILRRKTSGAVNFTASHNPAEYHGVKFSGPHGGPALPEVTREIEALIAKIAFRPREDGREHSATGFEKIDPCGPYLARLVELVDFGAMRKGKLKVVCDVLHGCGAGYLDRVLADQGIDVEAMRTVRDVLFGGTGPDVSEANLAPLREAVCEHGAAVGLATDGDADRFGIIDADGTWVSPNHILALLYDYLVETRGWRLPVARSVATTHLVDAVARHHGLTVYQTPVGFKYIGEMIQQDKIALGGEESAGLSIRGHVPEKDGILACLLVAEMVARRGTTLSEQLRVLFRRVQAEYWPLRTNLHLPDDVQSRAIARLKGEFTDFLGRRVRRADRTDGLKLEFEDGSWILMRLSGTEPLLRLYTEAASPAATSQLASETQQWIFQAREQSTAGAVTP